LFHLINISPMPQFDAASGCEDLRGYWGQKSKESGLRRMRSRDGHGGMGAKGMDTAAGTKNAVGGALLTRVVNATIGRGRGRILVPVDITVSVLDVILVGQEVGMDGTYQK
jgi:hypothetical protein